MKEKKLNFLQELPIHTDPLEKHSMRNASIVCNPLAASASNIARLSASLAAAFAVFLPSAALAQERQITPSTVTITAGDPITPIQYSVTGGTSQTKWGSSFKLPPGLQLSETGVLSGTPQIPGVWGNGSKQRATFSTSLPVFSQNVTIIIQPNAPTITSPANGSNLGSANLNRPFGPVEIAATGGVAPYTWNATILGSGGSVTINPTSPTTARLIANFASPGASPPRNYAISVTAFGNNAIPQSSATVNYTISLLQNRPSIVSPPSGSILGNATVGVSYESVDIAASGGFTPYRDWQIVSAAMQRTGEPVSNISIQPVPGSGNATARFTANFTSAGNATIRVRVLGDNGESSADSTYTIPVVSPPPPPLVWVTEPALPGGKVATAYSTNLTVSGGRPGYTYTTKTGTTLPPGLTLT
ncbi:MAG: hypothetical protein KGR46_12210, partial [Verrucomicrobia bacterium]|nr:hypothetical protein [Verrucomicrobiota bacterium]